MQKSFAHDDQGRSFSNQRRVTLHRHSSEFAYHADIQQELDKDQVGTLLTLGNTMGKPGKQNWGKVRQAFKDALPADPEFNRVDCLNLLMFLAHNPHEGMLIQDLELRLPDLGPKVESIVSKLIALGLVKNSLQYGTQLSSKAIELMSAPPS